MKAYVFTQAFGVRHLCMLSCVIVATLAGPHRSLAQSAPPVPSSSETTAQVNSAASSAISNFNSTMATQQGSLDSQAPNPTGDALPSTAGYQDQLNELTALQRQLELLKVQSNVVSNTLQIDQQLKSIKDLSTDTSASAAPAAMPPMALQGGQYMSGMGLPRDYVTMISGVPGTLKAFVNFDGSPVLATAGTTLPSGAKVSYVTQSGVYTDGTNGTPSFIGLMVPQRQDTNGAGNGSLNAGGVNYNNPGQGGLFNPGTINPNMVH